MGQYSRMVVAKTRSPSPLIPRILSLSGSLLRFSQEIALAEAVLDEAQGEKPRSMRKIATIGSVLCASVLVINADLAEQKKRLEQEFRNIPVPELPARAAQIVRSTPAGERSHAAILAVEAIAARHPGAVTTVASAISKAAPEASAAAAAAASRYKPTEAPRLEAAARPGNSRPGESKLSDERGRGVRGEPNGNGNGTGNGNGNSGEGRPEKPEHSGRPEKSELLPNGKPRPFPHHGHTDDPNHVHTPQKYNRPRPH